MAFINLLQVVYPVGAVYISTVNTSPSSLIGGTWTQITNAALRGATSIGYVGADTHTLTIKEMPSHNHVMGEFWHTASDGNVQSGTYYGIRYDDFVTASTGGGQAHSIVQRSYNCFIWYRTA